MIVPAEITIYEDRSFNFVTKAPADGRADPQGADHREGSTGARSRDNRHDHPGTARSRG